MGRTVGFYGDIIVPGTGALEARGAVTYTTCGLNVGVHWLTRSPWEGLRELQAIGGAQTISTAADRPTGGHRYRLPPGWRTSSPAQTVTPAALRHPARLPPRQPSASVSNSSGFSSRGHPHLTLSNRSADARVGTAHRVHRADRRLVPSCEGAPTRGDLPLTLPRCRCPLSTQRSYAAISGSFRPRTAVLISRMLSV